MIKWRLIAYQIRKRVVIEILFVDDNGEAALGKYDEWKSMCVCVSACAMIRSRLNLT